MNYSNMALTCTSTARAFLQTCCISQDKFKAILGSKHSMPAHYQLHNSSKSLTRAKVDFRVKIPMVDQSTDDFFLKLSVDLGTSYIQVRTKVLCNYNGWKIFPTGIFLPPPAPENTILIPISQQPFHHFLRFHSMFHKLLFCMLQPNPAQKYGEEYKDVNINFKRSKFRKS